MNRPAPFLPQTGVGTLSNRITPEIHLALMRALRSSTKFLGFIPRAQAIEAGTDETRNAAPREAREPGGEAMRPNSVTFRGQVMDEQIARRIA